ncbi:hypothetical protein HNQ80_001059 [Anaerosolibacter carboniphilus]|uniref:Uncharacterized protein n=1 Tax=Anaerosolibacter carboniphilus TaxID=1417629 RepID=A0A841KME9_9FIRM|nr:hypothetical protein [Anaerosolibacter carboniphilus]MBB6214974.1 hypothetical protein [Anaerosolibacter carboniphilus]
MEKHLCRVKFHNGLIVCASEVLCTDCPERKKCQEITINLDEKYEGVRECMSHDSYRREKRKMKQKRWGK